MATKNWKDSLQSKSSLSLYREHPTERGMDGHIYDYIPCLLEPCRHNSMQIDCGKVSISSRDRSQRRSIGAKVNLQGTIQAASEARSQSREGPRPAGDCSGVDSWPYSTEWTSSARLSTRADVNMDSGDVKGSPFSGVEKSGVSEYGRTLSNAGPQISSYSHSELQDSEHCFDCEDTNREFDSFVMSFDMLI